MAIAVGGVLFWLVGFRHLPALHDFARLGQWIHAQGPLAPVVFVGSYVLAEQLPSAPALPLTLLAGLLFGPLRGTVYVSLASTLAATLAFMIARSALREPIQRWIASKPRLRELDAAVAEHGWRILIVTRLVPLFPHRDVGHAHASLSSAPKIRCPSLNASSTVAPAPATSGFSVRHALK